MFVQRIELRKTYEAAEVQSECLYLH